MKKPQPKMVAALAAGLVIAVGIMKRRRSE